MLSFELMSSLRSHSFLEKTRTKYVQTNLKFQKKIATPAPAYTEGRSGDYPAYLTDIDHCLGNGIRSGDDLRIGLEITLSGNQIDQLLGQIDI